MQDAAKGQVSKTAADIYDEFFVPALFAQWSPRLAEATTVAEGQKVLDVACGTGVLAREALSGVEPGGVVTGLDINDGMLAVARRKAPNIDWRQGAAETMPFDNATYDVVLCQFGLMFFDDRRAALNEMWRVLRPGGRLGVAVWDSLENTPGYAAITGLLQRLFGSEVADAMRAPFCLGDREALLALFEDSGIADVQLTTIAGTARFASIDAWVHTDIKGWTLADMIDDGQFSTLLAEAHQELKRFVHNDGSVSFRSPAHIVTTVKR